MSIDVVTDCTNPDEWQAFMSNAFGRSVSEDGCSSTLTHSWTSRRGHQQSGPALPQPTPETRSPKRHRDASANGSPCL
ncbi:MULTISPECIES: hypothetical protein [unclassified Streptomyces]|uniref:hypothetical protein n=1 Tax=unclassified Streptomyces TaxID=2593676 RepID=UPI00336AC29A